MGVVATAVTRGGAWLLLLAVGIGASTYLLLHDGVVPRHEDHVTTTTALLPEGLDAVRALTLDDGEHQVRIERTARGWRYVAPGQGQARFDAAGDFIQSRMAMLSAARIERSFAAAELEASRFGLHAAALQVVLYLDGADAPTRQLTVGAATPDGFGRYVRSVAAEEILVLPGYQIRNLEELLTGPAL